MCQLPLIAFRNPENGVKYKLSWSFDSKPLGDRPLHLTCLVTVAFVETFIRISTFSSTIKMK